MADQKTDQKAEKKAEKKADQKADATPRDRKAKAEGRSAESRSDIRGELRSDKRGESRSERRKRARAERKTAKEAAIILRLTKRRHRIFPRTVIGISLLLMVAGLGAAASGVGLFMYYQDKTDSSIAATKDFSSRVDQSIAAIEAEGTNARAQVQNELEPLRKLAATGESLTNVLTKAEPSVWEVRTTGVDGAPVIATAFVVAADAEKSFLVSSYSALRAATTRPGPDVSIRKGERTLAAQLWTWDEKSDLALLIVQEGRLPRLDWAAPDGVRLGDQVFAVSGLGSKGAAITQGFVADVSTVGLQHTAPIGAWFEGAPLLSADGKVVAIGSLRYAPFGAMSTGAVSMAPPIRASCERLLRCPDGQVTAAGDQR
jgi:S1-C subfamily serine protease